MSVSNFGTPMELCDAEPARYDWSVKETVIFTVEGGSVSYASVSGGDEGLGMASYCANEGGCLDYMIDDALEKPFSDGVYVAINCTGSYYTGDGWTTDDDMDLEWEAIRLATDDEAKEI